VKWTPFSDHELSYGFVGLIDTKMIRPMKTKSKRKRHSAAFKAKVGMEAILGVKTVAQIAREYSFTRAGEPVENRDSRAPTRAVSRAAARPGENNEQLVAICTRRSVN
jgi:hypothetical protein